MKRISQKIRRICKRFTGTDADVQVIRLDLFPGDRLIIHIPFRLSQVELARLHSEFKKLLPDNQIFIIGGCPLPAYTMIKEPPDHKSSGAPKPDKGIRR